MNPFNCALIFSGKSLLSPFVFICLLTSFSCSNGQNTRQILEPGSNFGDYWFQGLAELSSYELNQSRYGEIRKGTAVLVFVTEDFSKSKHVKLDAPQSNPNDKITVLKLNFTRNFQTGIYPYSIMASSFMPIFGAEAGIAEKISTSVQEWCGHVYDQLHNDGRTYKRALYSYFESEGNLEERLSKVPLEQALWNSLRINPKNLPLGTFQILPDQVYSRLMHKKLEVTNVSASLDAVVWDGMELNVYELDYPVQKRKLSIYFQSEFPYLIEGWEEEYLDIKGELVLSSGKRIKTIQSDYWNKNSNAYNFMGMDLFHAPETDNIK